MTKNGFKYFTTSKAINTIFTLYLLLEFEREVTSINLMSCILVIILNLTLKTHTHTKQDQSSQTPENTTKKQYLFI